MRPECHADVSALSTCYLGGCGMSRKKWISETKFHFLACLGSIVALLAQG